MELARSIRAQSTVFQEITFRSNNKVFWLLFDKETYRTNPSLVAVIDCDPQTKQARIDWSPLIGDQIQKYEQDCFVTLDDFEIVSNPYRS